MTVAKTEDDGLEFETGLEDFDMEDAVVPRLSIVHKDQEFKDSLTGETFPKISAIILGLVKQRVLWFPTVDEGDWPMCRSANHDIGFPNVSDKQPKEKAFPWETSGFNPDDFPPDDEGLIRLPCAGCQLKEWKTHPDGKKPYCAEQFTLPLLYATDPDAPLAPAILTLQKTSLKPIKAYLTGFSRSQTPAFSVVTEIGLEAAKRGSNEYSIATLKRIANSDPDQWRAYATQYRAMRDFLTADPGERDLDEGGGVAIEPAKPEPVVEDPPAETVTVAAGQPAAAAATGGSAAPDDDPDALPF